LDNIEIPASIRLTPAVETDRTAMALKEKVAGYLVGLGFHEIMTNSISNSAFFGNYPEEGKVRLLNSLSSELDMLRPSMLETGLEAIAYNLNRKIVSLKFFEFGKTYAHDPGGKGLTPYLETDHLCLYLTGPLGEDTWHIKTTPVDFYYSKGVAKAITSLCGVDAGMATVEQADKETCARFDIRQPVYFVDIPWDALRSQYKTAIRYAEVPRFPAVQRDLALVVDEGLPYARIEAVAYRKQLHRLKTVQLFDVFRSDKIGEGKKSVALSFTFLDEEKTMTDKEIDSIMNQLMEAFESELGAGLRK
jgi:phenylalanyl-tRNA synthetase beta chain